MDIYPRLFTDPEGNNCFSIYQTSWIQMKNVTFCKQKTSLCRNLFTMYKHFGDFVKCIFMILLQIQDENISLPPSQSLLLSWSLLVRLLHLSLQFRLPKISLSRSHLVSGHKTVNSQGYSELWEPIKTHKNCYSLIW